MSVEATNPKLSVKLPGRVNRVEAWQSPLLVVVSALLVFETLTGLVVQFARFGNLSQAAVLLHTGVGLIFLIPFAVYQLRHWRDYRRVQLTHFKVTGYLALVATSVASVSGVVLFVQAALASRISYAWDTVHIVATYVLLASALPHIVLIPFRDRRGAAPTEPVLRAERGYGLKLTGWTLVLAAATAAFVLATRPAALEHVFPADYSWKYGDKRPFAPSLATTESGGAYDKRTLSGSRSCGSSGCHEQILAEWQVSAHRWAAMDPAFQAIQGEMAKQNGAESTRYCAGCHDPISLFSGAKTVFNDKLTNEVGYDEGVSCLSCHAVRQTDVKGNANYVMTEPPRYLFETAPSRSGKFVADFLIRAYPREHVRALSKRLFKKPEYCAACHKQFIDQEINQVGWVQLQNQYDNWKASKWNHGNDVKKTVECRECHMPLTASRDPAAGDDGDYNRSPRDGKHRSHRFVAANSFVPTFLKLPGGEEQAALTAKWLHGDFAIPEIADKWAQGPVVGIELVAPKEVAPGAEVPIKAVITSNKVGHDFPTGPLDIIQSWVHFKVTDETGKVIFESGALDDRRFIQPGSFLLKAEPVDRYGNLIDRHNLWEMVGVRYKRALFPGFADSADFSFRCPGGAEGTATPDRTEEQMQLAVPAAAGGRLTVVATLRYRKIDQYLLNFVFGKDTPVHTPVIDMASATATLAVVAPAKAAFAVVPTRTLER